MKIAAVCLLFCVGLSACGQKGPLYLPQPAKPQPEASEQSQPRQDDSSSPQSADPA